MTSQESELHSTNLHNRNRCTLCGRFVGDSFTGYTKDRMSDRGPLFCDPCIKRLLEQVEDQSALLVTRGKNKGVGP